MIWVRDAIVTDEALSIPALDRTFEHGLGLFETFRTWNRSPSLMERHLDRMRRSADALGLPIDPASLPTRADVDRLRNAEGHDADVVVRLTMSGGIDAGRPAMVWMRLRPVPDEAEVGEAAVRSTWRVAAPEPLAMHKSLNYWTRRLLHERARRDGFDEDLGVDGSGAILEGTRSNVFAVIDGSLVTPLFNDADAGRDPSPWLPGIMRGAVLDRARRMGLRVVEDDRLTLDALERAVEVFLTNGGRGITPVGRLGPHSADAPDRVRRFDAPGPVTRRLRDDLDAWLRSEDTR